MRKEIREKFASGAERIIVCIAGASASGKGEAADHLKRRLEEDGKKVCVLSTDDYYKGVSRIMSEKNIKVDEIDFDAPESVCFEKLESDLVVLKRGEKVTAPKYSMYLSEPTGEREINGEFFDVILLEGIWALNEWLVKYADVAVFVEADKNTLFIRRFRRDVLGGRSSHTPEFTLKMILEKVLPAYQKYILPTRESADMILVNNYTGLETFDVGQYDVQDKIALSEAEAEKLKTQWGEPRVVLSQGDYYFTNEVAGFDPEHLIRMRVENGRLKSLAHKGTKLKRADGKIIRPSEHFIKKGEFGELYQDISGLTDSFKKGGFRLEAQFSKVREIFQSGEVAIALDKIEGLGIFAELSVNNKLSKAPEIDKFKKKFNLENRRPIGPYIDEYLAKLSIDSAATQKIEGLLNADITRELILRDELCEVLEGDKRVAEAMRVLRKGYPYLPLSQQCSGRAFREAADIILRAIVSKTAARITDKNKMVVLLPWRSGLAFGECYRAVGANKFYHLSSKRNEETLETEVDYENGSAGEDDTVIIADPMLATGNTVVDAILRMKNKGVAENDIILNAVVAAPAGVARVKKDYPLVKIIVGALDEKLDHRGYIVPGLGDFGDKYFAEMSADELRKLSDCFELDENGRQKMLGRIAKQAVSETLSALLERDLKDMEIDGDNRARLEWEGLALYSPKKTIKVDTGRVGGVKNVANLIVGELTAEDRIISLEGVSGSGKTATADALKEKLGALKFSMGEVFRYLAYYRDSSGENDFMRIISCLNYRIDDNHFYLFDGAINVSKEKAGELRSPEMEKILPDIAAQTQKIVIEFIAREVSRLREVSDKMIILEGRAFTLDFIPSDIRVKLMADPSIRADRRWAQQFLF